MAKTLVIMAAGMGSRFGGDKQIAHLGPSGEILLEYSVFDAIHAGFDKIIFVIRTSMRESFSDLTTSMKCAFPAVEFILAYQGGETEFEGIPIAAARTKPLGTVHAVLSARKYIDSHFAVINADDYYGRYSFEALSKAMDRFTKPSDAALITYSLKNTLSPYGAVTRGICVLESNFLKGIRESYKVMSTENGGSVEATEYGIRELDPDSPVSMNMWAYNKAMLAHIENYFRSFLSCLDEADNKSECLLPVMAEHFIEADIVQISAYPTSERWFGLTYREDAADAAWELDKRHEDGRYPKKLF